MAVPSLRDLATRVLKTRYFGNADMLAQEIAAWAGEDGPFVLDRPLVLDQDGSSPPLQFKMNPLTDVGDTYPPPFVINVKGSEPVETPSFPGGTTVFDGGLGDTWNVTPVDFKPPDDPWQPATTLDDRPDRPSQAVQAVSGGGGGVGFYGQIVSKTSARVFSITYTLGDGSTETADFEMATLDDDADFDAGTEVTVFVMDSGNRFIGPIWL